MDETYLKLLPEELKLLLFLYMPLSVIIESCMGYFPTTICNNKKYWEKRSLTYYNLELPRLSHFPNDPEELETLFLRYFSIVNDYTPLGIRIRKNIYPDELEAEQYDENFAKRKDNAKRDNDSLREILVKLLKQKAEHDRHRLDYYVFKNIADEPLVTESYNIADAFFKVNQYIFQKTGEDELTGRFHPEINYEGEPNNISYLLEFFINNVLNDIQSPKEFEIGDAFVAKKI